MKRNAVFLTLTVFVLGLTVLQGQGRTVLDHVYSGEQAERGAQQYEAVCAHCHEGDEPDAIRPKSAEFVDHWREAPLSFLFTHISRNMPQSDPGSLSEQVYIDVLSYLLRENGYPAGTTDLSPRDVDAILMVGLDGPKPLPTSAMVRVVGCLVSAGDEWNLTAASSPVRVKTGDKTTAEEMALSAATPAGTASYSLRNAEDFNPGALKGQKVQAKGVYAVRGAALSVNVLSLERIGAGCEK